ncbi:hypothetical protein Bca52824_021466 [Brassica carinata]|uniref:Uncharacterized protein n=1 Tax=Brassica carinata TaxID=52824 RepID=A0A8X8APW6_BRACI|nr:hypothetical protein Bca52824_021466 [Brassica carinata]
MWGGFVNENSPAGVGLLRKICQHKLGRGPVSACSGMVEALCNIARSSDDWQYMMATECLLWLLQDPNTSHKVVDKAVPTLMDLAELTDLRDHKKLGDSINKVPDYAERLVKKQMRAAWLFREAALKHGGARRKGEEREVYGNESDDSEWETASGSDTGDDGRDHMGLDDEEEEKEEAMERVEEEISLVIRMRKLVLKV